MSYFASWGILSFPNGLCICFIKLSVSQISKMFLLVRNESYVAYMPHTGSLYYKYRVAK